GAHRQPVATQDNAPALYKRPPIRISFGARRVSSLLEDENEGVIRPQASTSFLPPQLHTKAPKQTNTTPASPTRAPDWDRQLASESSGSLTASPANTPETPAPPAPDLAPPALPPSRAKFVSIPPAYTLPGFGDEYACECRPSPCLKCLLLQDIARFSYIVNRGPSVLPQNHPTLSVQ
ncbi:hypothetical protein HDZ31DRAFT_32742, partial [Schizophyllum fasciatum]